jgi:hypothetical protein
MSLGEIRKGVSFPCRVFKIMKTPRPLQQALIFAGLDVLELALYHSLGKLPEPEPTHDFF